MAIISIRHGILYLIGWLLTVQLASAGELQELSLDERVSKSELVIIGKVRQVVRNTDGFGSDVALVTSENVLKGQAAQEIRFAFNGSIVESHSECCVVGGRYLLFMARNKEGEYYSVNGRYGVYMLTPR
ncbi:hypothetical protein HX882_07685 [Pseudomonas gingeri]|uniref:Uncharacterized protein n=1 Tax=Pseudomonas gingeri TaxID=117681 RepID=A0A7Y8C1M1_9PSED|nr:hypothetical protein [Pseudomonas gingeri]NWB95764.1 hypothetical protein [Pseudomonas gingeri]